MKRILMNFALLATMAVAASAATVWNTNVDSGNFTGSRTAPNVISGGNYSPDFEISWSIVPVDGTALYQYTYTFSGFRSPDVSHIILELSGNCVADDPCFNTEDDGELEGPGNWNGGASDPGWPTGAIVYGIKFNFGQETETPDTFTFTSDRIPVWGNFYVKGGSTSYAYNSGLAIEDFDSDDILDFIARPDTERIPPNEVPEPATYALIGAALVGLQVLRKRK